MAHQFTAVGDISYRGTGKAIKTILKNGNYKLCAGKYGQPYTIGKHQTATARWRRYDNFPQATSPLSEGVTPPGGKVTSSNVTSTMQQYGDWREITDVVWDTHEDNIPEETVKRCGTQMGETIEVLTIAVLKADSNVFYANNAGSRGELNSPALAGDFKRIERSLSINKAEYITSMIKASSKISTEPVDPAYIAMAHTNCKSDFENLEGWTPVKNYADSARRIHPAEAGSIGVFRCIFTPLFEPWSATGAASTTYLSNGVPVTVAAAADTYPVIITAMDAYGVVRLQGFDAVTPFVHKPKAIPGDELAQRGFVSWKTWFTAVVLNSNWLARYEVNVTSLP